MHKETLEIAVIGAGPIGIEAAIALKKEGFNYRHFEAGSIGSTIEWWAPETVFFSSSDRISIAGVPLTNSAQSKASREEYLTYLRSVSEQFKLKIETYKRIVNINRERNFWKLDICKSTCGIGGPHYYSDPLQSSNKIIEQVKTKQIILAIGDMHRPKLLNVPGEELSHVSHYFSDPHRYFGSKVLIVGAKNSAVEAAIRLARVGAKVTLSQRRSELDPKRVKPWLMPEIKSLIRDKKINYIPQSCVKHIDEEKVILVDSDDDANPTKNNAIEHYTDFVLLLTGYKQEPDLYHSAGITLEGESLKPAFNPETMETDQKGIYVAGTGSAGTQIGKVTEFIETSHVHIDKIIAHIKGFEPPKTENQRNVKDRES